MSLVNYVHPESLDQWVTTIPPAFDHNPYSYGFALFGMVVLASLSTAAVVKNSRDMDPHRDGYTSPITLSRVRLIFYCLTVDFLVVPDIAILLCWGEVTDHAMENLWALDRALDGASVLPFLVATVITIRGGQRINTALISAPYQADIWPTWGQVKDQVVILMVTALIAAGVALGKM
jgi:hypothetical protein